MTYPATPCRFIRRGARRFEAIVWWGTCNRGQHVARFSYAATGEPESDREIPPGWQEAPVPAGTTCEHDCGGAPYLVDAPDQHRSASARWEYDTPSGRPEPGCLYWMVHDPGSCFHWDNCDGRHLHAVCPDGTEWDVDSRARNCTMPEDRLHRCWVRTGDPEADPPTVHVAKDGLTCAAGAGSIATGAYHGFLNLVDGRSTFTAG